MLGANAAVVLLLEVGGMESQGLGGMAVADSGAIVGGVAMGGFVVWGCVVWDCVLLRGKVWSVVSLHGICCSGGMVVVVVVNPRSGCWLLNSCIIARMLSFKA